MPNEDGSINELIDLAAIERQFDVMNKGLDLIISKVKQVPTIKTDVEGAEGAKELSKAQLQYAESLKAVEKLMKDRFASEAKLKTMQTDYAKQTASNNLELQKNNKELKDQVAYQNATTGSIEKARAAVRLLNTERNQLNLYTKEGQEQQAKLNEQIDKYNAFIKKSVDNLSRQKISIGDYPTSAQIIVEALEKEKKKLEELEKTRIRVQNVGSTPFTPSQGINRTQVTGFAGGNSAAGFSIIQNQAAAANPEVQKLNQQIENSRKIVEGFSRVTEKDSFLNLASKVGDSAAQFKVLQKALIELERDGFGNTEGAKNLRKELAELRDSIADTKDEIKAMSSDTRGLDLFAGSVSFAADVFQTAAGAAVLFGASEEDAAAATKTLTAIQAVSNGVKGIANELTTRGTAANKIYALAQTQVAIVTDASATATARFAAATKLVAWVAIAAGAIYLISALSNLRRSFEGTVQEENEMNAATKLTGEILGKASDAAGSAAGQVALMRTEIGLAKEGFLSKDEVVKNYNDTIGKTTGLVKSVDEAERALNKNAEAYIQFTYLKAKATAAFAAASDELKKQISMDQAGPIIDNAPAAGNQFDPNNAKLQSILKKMDDSREAGEQRRIDNLLKIGSDALTKAAKLSKESGFDFF